MSFVVKKPSVNQGCVIPIEYGDPRFYQHQEDDFGFCISETQGWYAWEEDRSPSNRLPKRVKEQKIGENPRLTGGEAEGARRRLEEGAGAAVPGETGPDNRCHVERWGRKRCPYVVP